jgi:O-antigen/teichoic acid export membrane protein
MSIKAFIQTVKGDFTLILGNYFQQIASIIFGIIIAKKISPEAYGIFGLAILLTTYLKFLNLGGQFSINKRLSLRSDSWVTYNYMNLNIIVYPFIVGVVLFFLFFFNFIPDLNPYYWFVWLFLIIDNSFQLIQGIIRAKGLSKILGNSRVITGVGVLLLIVLFLKWKFQSSPIPLFLKLVLVPLIGSLYFLLYPNIRRLFFFPKIKSFKYFKFFILEGFVLGVYVFSQDFLGTIDRFFIATNFSNYDLGIYSFSLSIASPILIVLTTIMYMDYSRDMGLFKGASEITFIGLKSKMLKKFFLLYFIFAVLGVLCVYLLLNFYLISYKSSFIIVVILLLSYIPVLFSFPYSLYFVANGLTKYIIWIVVFAIIISVLLDLFTVYLGLDYVYFVCATFFSKFFMFGGFYYKFKKVQNATSNI